MISLGRGVVYLHRYSVESYSKRLFGITTKLCLESHSSSKTAAFNNVKQIFDQDGASSQIFDLTAVGSLTPKISAASQRSIFKTKHYFSNVVMQFLPKNYPHSVRNASEYRDYSLGNATSIFLGTINGVLSMQSLLLAVGLSNGMSIPLSGALNWLLKDGIGQFGGVLYASLVNIRFDSNPKFWRFMSTLLMETACLMELCLPAMIMIATSIVSPEVGGLAGGYCFLAVASSANILKNISFLTTSACRASIHKSFATHENLADITAKSGSQAILSSMAGTSAGIYLVSVIAEDLPIKVAVFLTLSMTNLLATYLSLKRVTINSLNCERLECILSNILSSESFASRTEMHSRIANQLKDTKLLTPSMIRDNERFLAAEPSNSRSLATLNVGSSLSHVFKSNDNLKDALQRFYLLPYVIAMAPDSHEVHLLFKKDANRSDVLVGFIHCYLIRRGIADGLDGINETLISSGHNAAKILADRLTEDKEWIIEEMLLETRYSRLVIE